MPANAYIREIMAEFSAAKQAWWEAAEYETMLYSTELAELSGRCTPCQGSPQDSPRLRDFMIARRVEREQRQLMAAREDAILAALEADWIATDLSAADESILTAAEEEWRAEQLAALEATPLEGASPAAEQPATVLTARVAPLVAARAVRPARRQNFRVEAGGFLGFARELARLARGRPSSPRPAPNFQVAAAGCFGFARSRGAPKFSSRRRCFQRLRAHAPPSGLNGSRAPCFGPRVREGPRSRRSTAQRRRTRCFSTSSHRGCCPEASRSALPSQRLGA